MSGKKKKRDAAATSVTQGRLGALDLSLELDAAASEKRVAAAQDRLQRIQQAYLADGRAAVILFEGWDAAGKGGAIRRIATVLDPRAVKVWPIAAPSDNDRVRHYLARFWERMPPDGSIAIFDRSWYGRVLVERVEGFCTEAEWRRAYHEINEFERQVIDDGARMIKLFLHISADEQLERFRDRLEDPEKRWKLTFEDFRNRDKRAEYERAIEDMLAETSTERAPWTLVAAEDKRHARATILEHVVDRLGEGVDLSPRPLDAKALAAAKAAFGADFRS